MAVLSELDLIRGIQTAIFAELAEEREKQLAKGYGPDHDDGHSHGEIALGAATYINGPNCYPGYSRWPFIEEPVFEGTRKDLIKAAAMLIAEIMRLDRAAEDAAIDTSDIPEADEAFFGRAELRLPPPIRGH